MINEFYLPFHSIPIDAQIKKTTIKNNQSRTDGLSTKRKMRAPLPVRDDGFSILQEMRRSTDG